MIEKASNWLKQLFSSVTFKAQAAGFDYRRLVAIVQNGGSFAVDPRYGITVFPGPRPGYRAYVYHLTGPENGGKHHIFFEVRGKNGNRPQGLKVGYTWVGRRPDEPAPLIPLDKPIEEPWGNKELGAGQIAEVWLTDLNGNEIGSDHVQGVHTGHDSDGPGNHRFHHSFFVLWYWEELELGGPTPPDEPDPPANGDVLARLDALEAGLRSANARLERVIEGLRVATTQVRSEAAFKVLVDEPGQHTLLLSCWKCGQVDVGQTGAYPCPVCDLPTVWDEDGPGRSPAAGDALICCNGSASLTALAKPTAGRAVLKNNHGTE